MQKMTQDIVNEALGEFLQVMAWRRDLHAHPELSFEEYRTAKYIGEALEHDGIAFSHIAGTGILARIRGEADESGGDKRAVVLRADIDALPVDENTGQSFASTRRGVMHACGHDFHTAILLGTLRILNRHRGLFSGTVLGLFQPGEELNPGGASVVLGEDPFAVYDPVIFVGEHVEPLMETGTFGFRPGQYMAASDELRFTVKGVGGHAAMRDRIKDPVQAAAKFIDTLYGIPQGEETNGRKAIISIGKLSANGATNVVPDEVYMEGTMRTFDEEWRAGIKGLIREKAAAVGEMFGVDIKVNISEGYPPVYNDPPLTEKVMTITGSLFGNEAVQPLDLRNTSDDFGFYSRKYPSVYYRLGVGGTGEFFENGEAGKIHTPTFRPDEKALGYGVVQFLNITLNLLG